MKNIKNQKGAISLFVVLAMLFFLAFMLGVFTIVSRRNASQLEAVRETAKIYSSGSDANTIYDSMVATNDSVVIPISTKEQLVSVKDVTANNTTANYTINGKLYTYKKGANYMLANDIILDISTEIDGKTTATIYDYMLYDTATYKIDMNNHNIYYQLSDGSLWKCIFYQNIGTSSSPNLFANNTEAGKSYTATKYSILKNGIDEFSGAWTVSGSTETRNFEFLLTYNCISQKFDITNKMYQRWQQTNNPTKEWKGTSDGSLKADGYVAITTNLGTSEYWGGLTLGSAEGTSTSAAYINGSVGHSNWYYAVGCQTFWSGSTYGIPVSESMTSVTNGAKSASQCLLFVRAK